MRFSVAFWHTFRGSGADPFGLATKNWPWEDGTNSLAMAKKIGHGKMVQIQSFLLTQYILGTCYNSEVGVYAYAAAQVKKAMEVNEEMKVNALEEDSPGRREMEMLRNVIVQSLMSACT
ncbi:hypothetical protein Dsin_019736 [Dipteronia sinensis]|uniref:xylose isomerase n=1 Tax=Dipteronia sinensis TaxID=43782 RepID=A0AAE0E304_9ROSI|nr:hypothetical protein Dsin_019736 [Dipteronia sinensis]